MLADTGWVGQKETTQGFTSTSLLVKLNLTTLLQYMYVSRYRMGRTEGNNTGVYINKPVGRQVKLNLTTLLQCIYVSRYRMGGTEGNAHLHVNKTVSLYWKVCDVKIFCFQCSAWVQHTLVFLKHKVDIYYMKMHDWIYTHTHTHFSTFDLLLSQ